MRIFALLLALLLAACARPLPPGVTELTYATPYSPTHPFSRADKIWMAFVEKASGGTLKIRPSWSGALLSSAESMTELRHGVSDIGLITPIYAKGGAQMIRIQSGFYSGARSVEQQVSLYRCLAAAHPEFASELAGLKILAVQGGSLPGVVTRDRPIRNLDDLKGLRLRAPSELLGVLRDLGADPVNMPMGEVYSALAKGILDGVIAPGDTWKALHFSEVAHYFTTLEVPRGAYPARAMGARRWNSLTPQQRGVLEAGVAVWEAALADQNRKALHAGLAEAAKHGVAIRPIAAAEQQRFDALYLRDAERNAQGLARFGLDGEAVFKTARATAANIGADGRVTCAGGQS